MKASLLNRLASSLKRHPFKWFCLIAVFATTAGFGSYRLTESPPTWYDEGMILQLAENLAHHGAMELQLAPGHFTSAWHVSTGYPVVAPVALSFYYFGVGILQARAAALLFIVLLIVATFLLLRKLFDTTHALWGTALVATFSSLYGDGKNILGEVPGLFFLVAFLLVFNELEKTRFVNRRHALLAGIFLGLTCATKPIFFLTIPALLMAVFINRKNMLRYWPAISAFLLGTIITGAIWIFTQFGPADSLISVLHFYSNPYNIQQTASPIVTNFIRFFTESTPIYTLLAFLIWTVAITIKKFRKTSIPSTEILAYLLSLLIMISYLRMPEGWYRYLFPANILILMFLPHNIRIVIESAVSYLNRKCESIQKYERIDRRALLLSGVVISCFLAFQTYHLLFNSWISNSSAGTDSATWGKYASSVNKEKSIFIYDAPEVVPFLKTDNYYQYFSGNGVWVAGTEYLNVLKEGKIDLTIIGTRNIDAAKGFLDKYVKISAVGNYSVFEKESQSKSPKSVL